MTACDGYLPVPTIRRDLNVRPAITNGVSIEIANCQLPTPAYARLYPPTDEVHDLHRVAFANEDVWVGLSFDDVQVVFDGHASRIDVELAPAGRRPTSAVELEAFAVESDRHCNQGSTGGVEYVEIRAYVSVLLGIPASQGKLGLDRGESRCLSLGRHDRSRSSWRPRPVFPESAPDARAVRPAGRHRFTTSARSRCATRSCSTKGTSPPLQ